MCIFGNNNKGGKPKPPPVTPPPNTGTVTNTTTGAVVDPNLEAAARTRTALEANRQIVGRRQGIFGNVRTSPTGDATFGSASGGTGYATFGGTKKVA
jgi:hypothetical protein